MLEAQEEIAELEPTGNLKWDRETTMELFTVLQDGLPHSAPPAYEPMQQGPIHASPPILTQPGQPDYCLPTNYGEPINDFMRLNIFVTLFCCLPLGLVGICFSTMSRDANQMGDYEKARRYSSIALGLGITSIFNGIILMFLYVLLKGVQWT